MRSLIILTIIVAVTFSTAAAADRDGPLTPGGVHCVGGDGPQGHAAAPFLSASAAEPTLVAQSSLACGLAPLPPLGCTVGACVCDQYGQNCHWTFVCR